MKMFFFLMIAFIPGVFAGEDVQLNTPAESMIRIAKFDDDVVIVQGVKLFDQLGLKREMFILTSNDDFESHQRWDQDTGLSGGRYCGDNTDVRYDAEGNLYVVTRRCYVPYNGYPNSFAIYRSLNKGLSWELFREIGTPFCGMNGMAMYVSPDAQRFFILTDSECCGYLSLHYSSDTGASWQLEHNVVQRAGVPFYPAILPDWENDRLVIMGMGNQGWSLFRVRVFDLITEDWTNGAVEMSTPSRNVGLSKPGWFNDDGTAELFVHSFVAQKSGRYRFDMTTNSIEFIGFLEKDGSFGQISKAFRDRTGVTYIYASFDGDLYRQRNGKSWELLRAKGPDEEGVTLVDVLTSEDHPNPSFDLEGGLLYRVLHTPSGEYRFYYSQEYERDIQFWKILLSWPSANGVLDLVTRVNETAP